jgi:hypothetical protein
MQDIAFMMVQPTMTFRSDNELVSTLYKCSIHGDWLTLRTVITSVGTFRFWQCPTILEEGRVHGGIRKGNGSVRCQTCKPCKYGKL